MASQNNKTAHKKPKLVRDSFTIPKAEFAAIDSLKLRAITLGTSVKKSELLRAGLKVLQGLSDSAYKTALAAVPALKTGRPAAEAQPVVKAPSAKPAAGKPKQASAPKTAAKPAAKAAAKPAAPVQKPAAAKKAPAKTAATRPATAKAVSTTVTKKVAPKTQVASASKVAAPQAASAMPAGKPLAPVPAAAKTA
jgi:hypothetical protein